MTVSSASFRAVHICDGDRLAFITLKIGKLLGRPHVVRGSDGHVAEVAVRLATDEAVADLHACLTAKVP